jgi:hypothetical protein
MSSAELARSVASTFANGKPNFTSDLPVVWKEAPGENPVAKWKRYMIFMRGLDLRKAAANYEIHRDVDLLETEIEKAYSKSEKQLKELK